MSIHIGLVPLSQNSNDVFTIYSTKSNLIRLQSTSNNVYTDIGDYTLGHRSNEPFIFSHKGSNIISFDSKNIILNKNVTTTSNLNIIGALNIGSELRTSSGITCSNITTSNIMLKNNLSNGYKFLDCTSNNIDTLYVTNENNGTGYIGGRIGIGVLPNDRNYSLVTSSNIYINGDIRGNNFITDVITSSTNSSNQIIFNKDSIVIKGTSVKVENLVLDGRNSFANLECGVLANISGLLLASNVSIYNSNIFQNPFKINQRLLGVIQPSYGNFKSGNPISVISQHINIVEDPTILELSSCGHLVLGDFPTLDDIGEGNIIRDYMIRGSIPTNRDKHFKGYLSFSSNNSEKSSFAINKSAHVSIGRYDTKALLGVTNAFIGDERGYIKPSSILFLENSNSSNILPFLKCVTSNSIKLQITSNATICFNENPIDMYKYNIESENSYLKNIDTRKIHSSGANGIIDMSSSTLSNIDNVYVARTISTSNINTSNVDANSVSSTYGYIDNLRVGTFSAVAFAQQDRQSVFLIGSDHVRLSGKNMVISQNSNILTTPPSNVNILTDKLIIETETSVENVNGYNIFGNNRSIKLCCKNNSVAINSFVAQELNNYNGGFAIVSKLPSPTGSLPEIYITPIAQADDPYQFPAFTITYAKNIKFGARSSINYEGKLFIRCEDINIDGIETKSANIGDGLAVFTSIATDLGNRYPCLNTNSYGSLDLGRGISTIGGPFIKQGGWSSTSTGTYIILNADYGVKNNTAGTLHIQVKGMTTQKLGNASISFLRFTGTPELYTINTHNSTSLITFTISAVPTGIRVSTDSGCTVCWTSIGSC